MTEIDWQARAEAAEARITAALAITPDEGAGTYDDDEDEGFANGWNEALASVRAALTVEEPTSIAGALRADLAERTRAAVAEPSPDQDTPCATCGGTKWIDVRVGYNEGTWTSRYESRPCPSCTPPDPAAPPETKPPATESDPT